MQYPDDFIDDWSFSFDFMQNRYQNIHPGIYVNFLMLYSLFLRKYTKNFVVQDQYLFLGIDRNFRIMNVPEKLILNDFSKNISDRLFSSNIKTLFPVRFFIIPIFLQISSASAHANIIIYDSMTRKAEIFEPNGNSFDTRHHFYNPQQLENIVQILEKTFSLKLLELIPPIRTCPLYGPQYYNHTFFQHQSKMYNECKKFNRNFKIGGYCASWSYFFTLLRLLNPEIQLYKLQTAFIQKYGEKAFYIIRKFHSNFLKFKFSLRENPNIDSLFQLKHISYNKNIRLCDKNNINGYNFQSLRAIARIYDITGRSRKELCQKLRRKLRVEKLNKKFVAQTCEKSESQGGLSIHDLRTFAHNFAGVPGNVTKRQDICKFLNRHKQASIK